MININQEIVTQLNKVLPSYYELFLDGHETVPCITYQIISNTEERKGNLNGYSRITIRVKLWDTTIEGLCTNSVKLDDKLAELGHFERYSVSEMTDGDLICWIFDYSILISEVYSQTRI